MDARQHAFLVRQPSATLKSRDAFWGMPKRGLAFLLANVMFWQPMWAQAEGIVVSAPGTSLGQAGNGVPIVNIATPNGSGLSHNQFKDYNVGQQGVILNNATNRTQETQLGGIILGNPNLKGQAAQIILNEVNGGSPSQLRGYTEVAGQSAHVIVANPYGISCNGCGFINTPRATLTTGKPVIENGQLSRYQVDQGQVLLEGVDLNFTNVDSFEIITRSARINAKLNAKNSLSVITGTNDVDARTLNATPRAANPADAPRLAIDSSALGGMYAGAIRLVGTEAGVGVKLDGTLAASGGDIQIDASGQLLMAQATANSGAINVTAANVQTQGPVHAGTTLEVHSRGDLNNRNNLTAGERIVLSSGGQLTNSAIIEAGVNLDLGRNARGDLDVSAQTVNNSGHSLIASRNLTVNATQTLNNQGGTLDAGQQASLTSGTLDNRNQGRVLSRGSLNLNAGQLLNAQKGLVTSKGPLSATLGQLSNRSGELSSLSHLVLNIATLDNVAGLVTANQGLSITASGVINNQGGQITSLDTLQLTAGAVDNSALGKITSSQALTASVGSLDQHAGGRLSSVTSLLLDVNKGQLNNQSGLIRGSSLVLNNLADVDNQGGEISSAQAFNLAARNLDNSNDGKLISDQALTLRIEQALNNTRGVLSAATLQSHSASLNNSAGMLSSRGVTGVTVDGAWVNQSGTLIGDGDTRLEAASLDNTDGKISGKQDLTARIAQATNHRGVLIATGALKLDGSTLDNSQNGLLGATRQLELTVGNVNNRGGEVSSKAGVKVQGAELDNSAGGKVIAGQALTLNVAQVLNQSQGLLSAQTGSSLTGTRLDNRGGRLLSQGDLGLAFTGELDNGQGLLSSEGQLSVDAGGLSNLQGRLSSKGLLKVNSRGALNNQGGQLIADGSLTLDSASLDNSQKGILSSKSALKINTGTFDNSQAGSVSSSQTLEVLAKQLSNQDKGSLVSEKALNVNVTGLDQQGGKLFSNTSLELNLNNGQLNNQGGLISAPLLMLKNLKGVNNQNGEISSSQAFTLAAESLDNSAGKVLGNEGLTLRIAQALGNLKGLIAAQSVDARAATLNNSGGTLTSRGDTVLNIAGGLDNQAQGLINASKTLTLNSTGLNNQQGSLLGAAVAIDLGTASSSGDLNNNGGLITTAGPLTLQHLRDLSNQKGEISTTQNLSLSGRTLDNSAGKLISNNLLSLNGNSLINQGGLVSGWQGVDLKGNALDNRNLGNVSSRYGNVDVTLDKSLLNSGAGALVSRKALTVRAGNLDNRNQGSLSSGAEQTLIITGELNNARIDATTPGGLIDSGTTLDLRVNTLDNAGGAINAEQALNVTAASLDNSQGTLIGNGALTLDLLGALTNTNGQLASAGALLLKRASQVNNQGGQLASQSTLTLLTGGLDNRNRGTVAANDTLSVTASGAVQNSADGLIYSQKAGVNLSADSLVNAKGTLQSQAGLTLTVKQNLDNQSGKVLAQTGDTLVTAGSIDNRGGTLAALKGALEASASGGLLRNDRDLDNNRQAGIIQAQRVQLSSAGINNNGGRIAAQTGEARITTGAFDNRDGGLYSSKTGLIKVIAASFDNGGEVRGQVAGGQVELDLSGALNNQKGIIESDKTLTVSAVSVDNQGGQLRALGDSGKTRFQIGGLFDNRGGRLETANTDLSFQAGDFQNAGGNVLHVGSGIFGMAMDNLNNAGGNLVSRGGLTVDQDTWSNTSVVQAGRLTVNVNTLDQSAGGQLLASESFTGKGVNWTTNGLIASDGSFDLALTGSLNSTGRATSLGAMNITVGQLSLSDTASISGGGMTAVNVAGALNNSGRLTSASDLSLSASGVNNFGTLGSAQKLTLTTGALLNERALIFSGGDMSLRVDSLNNSYADIYSMGRLSIDRDGQGSLASSIINSSSSLQSDGDMSLAASTIQNVRAVMEVKDAGIYTARINELPCDRAYVGDCKGGNRNGIFEVVQRSKLEVSPGASAASSITTGANLTLRGDNFSNSSSTVGASANLSAQFTNNFTNSGVETGDTEQSRTYITARKSLGGHQQRANAINQQYWYESSGYDAQKLGGLEAALANFVSKIESEISGLQKTTPLATGDQSYSGVIQAGGGVSISAGNNIDNSVVRPGYVYVGSGAKTNTAASGTNTPGSEYSTQITLNQQLPPDLAQQQVNPLALPGFSLPAGQNGLFRLSTQDSSTPTQTGPQSWTLGSARVSAEQREQGLPVGSGLEVQSGDAVRAPASDASLVDALATSADSQAINRVQGLPDSSTHSQPHKYLIETNPALTNLKQFMSSDYLLSNLGYNPDDSWKRLGDGFYEQKLIQQAVVARTGQRFLAGQNTDEKLFKYLMDNAIKSKQQLNLAVGVSLTSEQVAALTYDIVWLEKNVVNGEEVLVPVLYLAQAKNRLAPNGALIAGNDLNLMAGKNLDSAGTLRATSNLSAAAGENLVNSGLVEAGNRLDLLAGNNLVNKAGGIIAGRDVNLTTTRGDVVNERTVTSHQSSGGYRSEQTDFVDNAARIEAANNLSLGAGRDINNVGGVLISGADTTIKAGRDVNIASAEQVNGSNRGTDYRDQRITQYGSSLEAGRDVNVSAGRDINAIASDIEAKRDIAMAATENLTLSSAANEQHSYGKTKKVTSQEDHVSQVSTTVKAGGDISLSAGKDLELIASRVNAGDEAYLAAGANLALQSAEETDYSFYSKVKKSSSGKKSRLDEVASTTNIASSVTSGNNSVLIAGNDLLVKGSEVAADKGAAQLSAGNDVHILAVSDSNGARHESSKSKSSWGGLKASKVQDKLAETQTKAVGSIISGNTVDVVAKHDATVTGSALVSTQDLTVQAGNDLTIDAAENTFTRSELHKQKNRDLMGVLTANNLGVDDITGNQHLSISSSNHTGKAAQTTLTGSTVGSSEGNVTLEAGRELKVVASELVSTRDMQLKGSNVTIAAGMESASQSSTDKSRSLAVGRVIGGTVVDTARSIRDGVKAAKDADDSRLKAVKLAQVAMDAYNLGGYASDANDQRSGFKDKQGDTASNGSLIKIGTELANTRSKRTSEYTSETAKQSTLNVGKELSVVATGKAPDTQGDIHVVGSDLKAGSTTLLAKNDITLESAQNTTERKNDSSNDKTSIGASFNIGQQNGFTLDLGAQMAKGMGAGSSVTQVNSTVKTGALLLSSGQDTTLAGAQVQAESIKATIGGDLNIASRQDTDTQKSKQSSGGVGASICVPPFCYGSMVTASGSASAGSTNSDYKAVADQSGLFAGKDGYMIDVGKNTTLQGAVIASEASADKNLLVTDRLLTSDIKNTSKIDSMSASVSVSSGSGGTGMGTPTGMALGESDHSWTQSAVSEGTIVVRKPEGANDLIGLNRDTANANQKLDKPDEKAMRERMDLINSSAALAQSIGNTIALDKTREAQDADSDTAKAARQKLLDKGIVSPTTDQVSQQVQLDYGVGSSFQCTTQTVTAIVQGIAGGNIGAAIAGASAPYLARTVKEMTEGDATANLMAHAVLGAVLARAGGNSALAGAGGAVTAEVTARLIRTQLYGGVSNEELTPEQKQTISALSTLAAGIAGSAVGKDALNAVAAAQVGKNAVENNQISLPMASGEAMASLADFMVKNGAGPEEVSQALRGMAEGQGFDGPMPANAFVEAWAYQMAGEGVAGAIGVLVAKILGTGVKTTGVVGEAAGAKSILTPKDFPDVAGKISQKQLRHIEGRAEYRGGGYLSNQKDAQAILDAYKSGQATVVGQTKQGFPIVKFDGVTGTNVNIGANIPSQPTNIFIIKGTKSPSIVPTNPKIGEQ